PMFTCGLLRSNFAFAIYGLLIAGRGVLMAPNLTCAAMYKAAGEKSRARDRPRDRPGAAPKGLAGTGCVPQALAWGNRLPGAAD
ncbi:hypothetical protein, partial [Paracoccus spongiarum]